MTGLAPEQAALVTAAVTAVEAQTDGEIVTVIAARSDAYHDVVLHWSLLLMLLGLAAVAALPGPILALLDAFRGWEAEWTAGQLLSLLLGFEVLLLLIGRLLFGIPAIRLWLTPAATKHRRVRRRAELLFAVAVRRRTRAATGVLLYLSVGERRAEIVADRSIADRVAPEVWGEAMAALLPLVRDGRPGEGMAAAVERIGAVLAEHFPRSSDDRDELSDRLIEL